MSTKKRIGGGRKEPLVKPSHAVEVRRAMFESLQASIAGSLPPIEPDTGRGVTHDLWVSVTQQLPKHDGLVEVWNTGIDQVEDAFFDAAAKRWQSPNPFTVYMFGEITHWREKPEHAGSAEQGG